MSERGSALTTFSYPGKKLYIDGVRGLNDVHEICGASIERANIY